MYSNVKVHVSALFPTSDEPVDINDLAFGINSDVEIVVDSELKTDVFDMFDKESKIIFNLSSVHRFVVLQFKHVSRFFRIDVQALDSIGRTRNISIQNNRGNIYVMNDDCAIPLVTSSPSWQILKIDIEDILMKTFGTSFNSCSRLEIQGSLKISKVYLESADYCDAQLPKCLRVVTSV